LRWASLLSILLGMGMAVPTCFVSVSGTSSTTCGSTQVTACRTIGDCVRINTVSGTTSADLLVLDGTHDEEICDVRIIKDFSLVPVNRSATVINLHCNTSRIFNLQSATGSNTTLSGINFVKGNSTGDGGCILASLAEASVVTISDCSFEQCVGRMGGAISSPDGPVSIQSCTFKNNSAARGGALSGSFDIQSSGFFHNFAIEGGALFVENVTTISLSGVSMSGNTAVQKANAVYIGQVANKIDLVINSSNIEVLNMGGADDSVGDVVITGGSLTVPSYWTETTVGSLVLVGPFPEENFAIIGGDVQELSCEGPTPYPATCDFCTVTSCKECRNTGLCQSTGKSEGNCFSQAYTSCSYGVCQTNETGIASCPCNPSTDPACEVESGPWYKQGWFTAVIVGVMGFIVLILGVIAYIYKRMHPERYEYTRLD